MYRFKKIISEIYVSIVITLLSISSWSVFVLFFRPLYYWSIKLFHIESASGFTKEKIISNYNALINYFIPFAKEPLTLPSLGQSPQGMQHFAEVRDIFNILLVLIPVTLILLLLYIYCTKNSHTLHYLKTASIVLILAPLLLGSGFVINFDKTFTLFHKLFFNNDYWIFNPQTDPIIKMLPEEFFMLCGIVIILFQLLTSLVCYLLYRRKLKKG